MHFAQTSVALDLSWLTAHLYEDMPCIFRSDEPHFLIPHPCRNLAGVTAVLSGTMYIFSAISDAQHLD